MKNKELYDKTVNILVDAYFNDTLEHGNCKACAVGNIVAANVGVKLVRRGFFLSKVEPESWEHNKISNTGICTQYAMASGKLNILPQNHETVFEIAKQQEVATGYTFKELGLIEEAFERVGGKSEDERMFNGLMAVIEVLDQIHENKDEQVTKSSKQKFVKV